MKVAVRLEIQVTYNETHLVEVEVERVSSDSDIAFNSRVYDLAKEKYLEGESVRVSQDPVENQDYEQNVEKKPLDIQYI
jgi:hypothetical protein